MAKQSGLGDNFYLDEYDLSGDVGSLQRVGGGPATGEVTGINKFAPERIGTVIDGVIDFTSFFNDQNTAPHGAFQVLKTRPVTDRLATYCRGTTLGSPAASALTKQVTYDPTRGADGMFTFGTNLQSNATGVQWGVLLTAGKRTDTAATSPVSGVDLGALPVSYSFGWTAYLHLFSFTGTSVTVTLQDSADGTTFTSLAGGSFTAAAAAGVQRLASSSSTATVRRYMRAITTGTFTNAVFAVNFVRHEVAVAL
jgi:hypothetical protein